MTKDFPTQVSYNRLVELQKKAKLPMATFLKTCCMTEYTGISFVDSTKIAVCKNKRIKRNKVFNGIAAVANQR